MSCREYERYGMGYLYGELGPKEKSIMDAHCAMCSYCSEELGRDRTMLARFEALPVHKAPALDRARREPLPAHPWFLFFKSPFTAALAASLTLLVIGMAGMSPMQPSPTVHLKTDSTVLTWQDPDETALASVQCDLEDTGDSGNSLYDRVKQWEGRDEEDTVSILRKYESYHDEIKTLSLDAAGF